MLCNCQRYVRAPLTMDESKFANSLALIIQASLREECQKYRGAIYNAMQENDAQSLTMYVKLLDSAEESLNAIHGIN